MSLCKRMFMVLSLVVAGLSLVACGEESAQVDHRFEIPADATERLNRGERVTVLPQTLAVNVGDTMTTGLPPTTERFWLHLAAHYPPTVF